MNDLTALHCKPLQAHAAMNAAEIAARLQEAAGWSLIEGSIEQTVRFADDHQTMAFVNAVAWIAHREDHLPDIAFGYSRCTLRFNTHSVGGICLNDFICAAKVDALAA